MLDHHGGMQIPFCQQIEKPFVPALRKTRATKPQKAMHTLEQKLRNVRDACLARGKPLGIFTADVEAARSYVDQGFVLLSVGVDAAHLGDAAEASLAALAPAARRNQRKECGPRLSR